MQAVSGEDPTISVISVVDSRVSYQLKGDSKTSFKVSTHGGGGGMYEVLRSQIPSFDTQWTMPAQPWIEGEVGAQIPGGCQPFLVQMQVTRRKSYAWTVVLERQGC